MSTAASRTTETTTPQTADVTAGPRTRLCALGLAGLVATTVLVVLTTVAGGHLGAGPFEPVGVPVGWLALAVLG